MSKLKVILIAAISLIVAIILYLKPNDHASSDSSESFSPSTPSQKQYDRLEARPNLQTQDAKNRNLEIFKPISDEDLPKYTIPDHIHAKDPEKSFFFTFEHDVLDAKKKNDEIAFQVLAFGVNRTGVINSVEQGEDDIVQWSGYFKGYPKDQNYFTLMQTKKDNYAIMEIYTDHGHYIAEIKDGVGLLTTTDVDFGDDGIAQHDAHSHE